MDSILHALAFVDLLAPFILYSMALASAGKSMEIAKVYVFRVILTLSSQTSLKGSQKVKHAKDSGYQHEKCVSLSSATTTLPWTHGAQLSEPRSKLCLLPWLPSLYFVEM